MHSAIYYHGEMTNQQHRNSGFQILLQAWMFVAFQNRLSAVDTARIISRVA